MEIYQGLDPEGEDYGEVPQQRFKLKEGENIFTTEGITVRQLRCDWGDLQDHAQGLEKELEDARSHLRNIERCLF